MSSSSAAAASASASTEEIEGNSGSNDLIINDGFPALNNFKLSNQDNASNDDKKDPVPRYSFASFSSALSIAKGQYEDVIHDCDLAFTARAKEESDAYSSGATFFMPASMKPRCLLEQLALNIFKTHTKGLEPGKHFDVERSGAEWWTLVLDTNPSAEVKDIKPKTDSDSESSEEEEDDEVGMHFDADYGLEHQLPNYLLHPRVATVTYLSNVGVPTLILNKRSPPPTDVTKQSLNGSIDQAWLSCPLIGKHIAFDGRLLHGAPGTFFPSFSNSITNSDKSAPPSKRRKLEDGKSEHAIEKLDTNGNGAKRITFMVNIWLNHCPIDAELIDNNLCSQMKSSWEEETKDGARLKCDSEYAPSLTWLLNDAVKSNDLSKEKIAVEKTESKWAGREECVICNREVDMKYCCTMKDLHSTTKKAHQTEGRSLEIQFEPDVLKLEVGEEIIDSDDDEDDEEQQK